MNKLVAFITERSGSLCRDLGILSLTFGIIAFQMLWHFPLMEPDEGRYSEIPREMLEQMDFITPTLNYVKYFEKPPLLYWMNSLSFAVFGQNEFAARFPCALCGLLTILVTYLIGRELFNRRVGVISAVMVGTSIGFLPMARINLTDMPLTFCMTLSFGAFILAVKDKGKRKSLYYYLFYAGAALAVLAKGLIGMLFPGAIIFLFLLLRKKWGLLKEMRLFTGIILFLLIAAPWFILVSTKNPEFANFFFIHEHFDRFLTKVHDRYEPFWYFTPLLLGIMLPWSVFIPSTLKRAWQNRNTEQAEALAWLAIWAIFIFLFFSKSNSKLPPYILPVVPPLAVMIAYYFDSTAERGGIFKGKFIAVASCIAVAISIAASFIVYSIRSQTGTSKPLALKVVELAKPDDMIASFGYDQTLPFYTKRRIVVVGPMGELEFGSKQGDNTDWFIDINKFSSVWESERVVYLSISLQLLSIAEKAWKSPPRVVVSTKDRALVTNH